MAFVLGESQFARALAATVPVNDGTVRWKASTLNTGVQPHQIVRFAIEGAETLARVITGAFDQMDSGSPALAGTAGIVAMQAGDLFEVVYWWTPVGFSVLSAGERMGIGFSGDNITPATAHFTGTNVAKRCLVVCDSAGAITVITGNGTTRTETSTGVTVSSGTRVKISIAFTVGTNIVVTITPQFTAATVVTITGTLPTGVSMPMAGYGTSGSAGSKGMTVDGPSPFRFTASA